MATPIYSVSAELGAQIPFPGASIDKEFVTVNPDSNPLIAAYRAYKTMPYDTSAPAMVAALYAARPKEGYFNVSDPEPSRFGTMGTRCSQRRPRAGIIA